MPTARNAPARLAEATPPMTHPAPNVIATIAPSDAPAETPRVYGVASAFRSRPWNTTPAAASVPPTSAAASARGSRARKKICASTLSANGTDPLKTRENWIGVEPMNGAATTAATMAGEARADERQAASKGRRHARARCVGRAADRIGATSAASTSNSRPTSAGVSTPAGGPSARIRP